MPVTVGRLMITPNRNAHGITMQGSSIMDTIRHVMPPTLSSLLDDDIYRKYARTVPRIPANLSAGNPWAVWAITRDGRWRGGQFPTYADGWRVVVKAIRNPAVADVSIVSRRKLFLEPAELAHLVLPPYDWCPRCRRPTMYELYDRHHAIPKHIPCDPEKPRCLYCGLARQEIR